jgi:hypothetical protein
MKVQVMDEKKVSLCGTHMSDRGCTVRIRDEWNAITVFLFSIFSIAAVGGGEAAGGGTTTGVRSSVAGDARAGRESEARFESRVVVPRGTASSSSSS